MLCLYRQNQYMGFGLSGSNMRTEMVGADVSIAWVDSAAGMPNAQDYYLTARSPVSISSYTDYLYIMLHRACHNAFHV